MLNRLDQMLVINSIESISISGGGTSAFMADFLAHMQDSYELHLVSPFHKEPEVHLPEAVKRFSRYPESLNQITNSSRTIMHVHGIWLPHSHIGITSSRKAGIPVVVSPHGMLEPWAMNHSRLKKAIAWGLYQRRDLYQAAAFHATSHMEAINIRNFGFKQPIAVIANGVELPKIAETRTWGAVTSGPRTALFLSRINPKKGLPMLLDVWAKIAPSDWQLVIAGNDDANHLPKVEAKILEHQLQDSVSLVGPLFGEEKKIAFREADLFILPSYSENFGIVVTEALGYQIPVLTTTGCPWGELASEDCGWWVEPTHEGIEAGLRKALSCSSKTHAEMGSRGRRLVKNHYLWPAISEKMSCFYDWILHGGKKPDFVV